MTKSELKSIIKECVEEILLDESIKIKRSDNFADIITDKKLDGVPVTMSIYIKDSNKSDDEIKSEIDFDQFEKDFNLLKSQYSSIKSKLWKMIEDEVNEWHYYEDEKEEDYFKKLKKYIIMDCIAYHRYKEKDVSKFEIWFNNESHNGNRNKVLGGHSISYEIGIKNGEVNPGKGIALNG